MKKKKNIIRSILIIVALIVFISSAALIIKTYIPKKNKFVQYIKTPLNNISSNSLHDNPIDFSALKAQNSDVCAFIMVDGTNISNPILQSGENTNEDFYLTHDINKAENRGGAIYIQKDTSLNFEDKITVVYGHNMRNSSMFGSLDNFRKSDFFDKYKNIIVVLPNCILKYEIFSAFLHTDEHIVTNYAENDDTATQRFIELCKSPTKYIKNLRNTEVTADDKLLVLSTCYGAEDERFLVVAKLCEKIITK